MGTVTIADVLRMPAVWESGPRILAAEELLGREVRWVHAAELKDIAPLLRGGDLLLSTGIALPGTPEELRDFAFSLAASHAVGLLIELGRRWEQIPDALIGACSDAQLPLVALAHEVKFASIIQSVGERIVDEQLTELRAAQRVHDIFTELSIAEAGPLEILQAVQRLSGAAVALESDEHRVLNYLSGPDDVTAFLANWAGRSRRATIEGHTGWDERNGWLITRLGKRGRGWGRLIVQSPTPPPQRLVAMAERAAAALALHRLHDRQRDTTVRRLHHELILGLLADPTDPEIHRRCELVGFDLSQRQLIGLHIRPHVSAAGPASESDSNVSDNSVETVISRVVRGADALKVSALVSEVDQDVRVLLSCAPSSNCDRIVAELATRVSHGYRLIIGAGRPVDRVSEVDRALREAQHVVSSVRAEAPSQLVHRLEDVHLRGLLTLLGEDDRLRLFVSRELDSLKAYDRARGTNLVDVIRALVMNPGSKSDAAASLHVSRPVFYDRVAKASRVVGADLDDPDLRVSLHVALVADELGGGHAP